MRKTLAVILTALMLNLILITPSLAQQPSSKEEKEILQFKQKMSGLKEKHQGEKVSFTLRDGTKVKGYLGELADDHFVVFENDLRHPVRVEYAQVKNFKTPLGTGFKLAIGISVAIAGLLAICAVTRRCEE
jgi:hypothetical protein